MLNIQIIEMLNKCKNFGLLHDYKIHMVATFVYN